MSVLIFFTALSAGRIARYLPNILNSMPFTIILNTDSGFGIAAIESKGNLILETLNLSTLHENILRIRLSSPNILNVLRVSIATMPVFPTNDGLHDATTVSFAPFKSDLISVLLKPS